MSLNRPEEQEVTKTRLMAGGGLTSLPAIDIPTDIGTADIKPQVQPQQITQIEKEYGTKTGKDYSQEELGAMAIKSEIDGLSTEERKALLTAMLEDQPIPDAISAKMPNFMTTAMKEAAESTPKGFLGKAWEGTKDLAKGSANALWGTASGAVSGMINTGVFALDALNWVDDLAGWDWISNQTVEELRSNAASANKTIESMGDGTAYDLGMAFGRNLAGYVAAGGALKAVEKTIQGYNFLTGLKMLFSPTTGRVAGELAKGAMATMVGFDPDDERFSDLIQRFPALSNPLTEYLASNPEDSLAEKRFKQALDSVFGDALMGIVFTPIKKVAKLLKKSKITPKEAADVVKLIDETSEQLEKTLKTGDNNIGNGGVSGEGRSLSTSVEMAGGGVRKKRPNRGKGKIKYDEAAALANAEGGDKAPYRNIAHHGDVFDGRGTRVSPDPVGDHSTASSVPGRDPAPITQPPQIDVDAALAEAQRLYRNEAADAGVPLAFRPTQDVANAKYYSETLLQDGGTARLLGLGNDINTNVLNRKASEFTTKSLDETAREARDILQTYSGNPQLLADLSEAADFAETMAHKVVMGRDAMAQGAYVLGGILKHLDDPTLDAAARTAIIEGEAKTALRNYAELASYFDRISTGTARALNAHKIKGELSKATELIATNVNKLSPDEAVALMRRVSVVKNPIKAAKMLRVVEHSGMQKFAGMVTEYWVNSILSGLVTHAVNFTGNMIKAGVLEPLDNMLTGWGGFRGGIFTINNRETWNQGVRVWWGMAGAFRDSWDMAVKAFQLGSNILKADNSFIEQQARRISSSYAGIAKDSVMGKMLDGLGAVVNIPTRFAMSADEFASQMVYRGNVRIHLLTQAQDLLEKGAVKGVDPREFIEKYIKDNFDRYFADAVTDSGAVVKGGTGSFKQGLDAAMSATYTKPLARGTLSHTLQQLSNKHLLVRHLMPFVRTPVNILDDALQRMPLLRNLSAEFRAARIEGGEAWARAQAKMYTGLAFMGTATSLYLSGNITGSGPKDKATRDALMATGWRPHSIKIGGKYYSYARLEPFATLFGLVCDASDIATASYNSPETESDGVFGKATEAVMAVLFGVSRNLASKTYFTGVGEFITAAGSDNPAVKERFLTRYAAGYVPNILNSLRKINDPTMKEVRGIVDAWMDRIPGLSDKLPTRYSWITGQPIQYMGGRASGFSPVVWESDKGDPLLELLAQNATALSAPTPRVNNKQLTTQQLSDYHRLHGTVKLNGKNMLEALRDVMNRGVQGVVTASSSETATLDPRVIQFNHVIKKYREKAREELVKLYPELKKTLKRPQEQERFDRNYRDKPAGVVMAEARQRALEAIATFK